MMLASDIFLCTPTTETDVIGILMSLFSYSFTIKLVPVHQPTQQLMHGYLELIFCGPNSLVMSHGSWWDFKCPHPLAFGTGREF